MKDRRIFFPLLILAALLLLTGMARADDLDAPGLVKKAVNYYRGQASVSTVDMTIHRPDWERKMTIEAWTKGEKDSIFIIAEPPKDAGNGTLKKDREMWTYNPKVNRVIKLPPSMMSQSWQGSDFSNNDLAKSDSIMNDYDHSIESNENHENKTVYVIKSMPKPAAPVVWGMQKLKIREDFIILAQEFYDEDLALVKAMTTEKIEMMGGRLFPKVSRMKKADAQDEFTMLEYQKVEFVNELPDSLFTLSNLKNPRR
ncbi:MAG: outer membrane lipoprotein-sorting protein [Proteobacteria bacterium]|nr:outer membrane lipoprotein-sorting protein [Pseudomonadota bacterium]